jgi:hypothetical protein
MLPDVNMVIKRDQSRTFTWQGLQPQRGSCRQYMMYGKSSETLRAWQMPLSIGQAFIARIAANGLEFGLCLDGITLKYRRPVFRTLLILRTHLFRPLATRS